MRYAEDNIKQRLFQQSRGRNSKINNSIGQISNSSQILYMSTLSAFQEDPIKTERVLLMTKSNKAFFSNQGDITLNLMIRAGQFSKSWDFTHVHYTCKFQDDPIKTEWVTLMTKSNRLFQQSRGRNSEINDPISKGFALLPHFMQVHLISKF